MDISTTLVDVELVKAGQPAPLHALELRISIGAHSAAYAAAVLEELAWRLRSDGLNNQCSGGWDGCFSVTVASRDVTADAYRTELRLWSEAN
jgi:hypothetical protein